MHIRHSIGCDLVVQTVRTANMSWCAYLHEGPSHL